MDKLGSKTLKIILFIGVFAYFQYHGISHGTFSIDTVTGGFLLASIAYLFSSLFGLILDLSRNYIIAIVGTIGLIFFLCFKMDEVVAKTPWLSEDGMSVILIILAGFCLIRDILIIKKTLSASTVQQEAYPVPSAEKEDSDSVIRNQMKTDPQSVLHISNMLENQWGRKPSYEEIMDCIDHMVIPKEEHS